VQIFISGKVVLQDGSPLTESAEIQSVCSGRKRTEAYSDPGGGFTFQFSNASSTLVQGGVGEGDSSLGSMNPSRSLSNCEIRAALPGFTSDSIDLGSRLTSVTNANLGRITLRHLGNAEGSVVSATAAAAPEAATKAFVKGREEQRKSNWNSAEKKFREAVAIYPQFAPAWFELGRTQVLQDNVAGARVSFEEAGKADPKFVSPYQALAELAAREGHWAEVAKMTDAVLALNATDFPQVWFMNAIANFDLHILSAAEKSVREGMKLDAQHRMPKMEYLLGLILAQQSQYAEATQHLQAYLRTLSAPAEIANVQKQLAKLALISATAATKAQTASVETPK
jgi:cytochrome c-type biogenesis protein CcmH/NrfG